MAKIKRDAFAYMDGNQANFAQCESCCWTQPIDAHRGLCCLLNHEVADDDTCGAYVQGWYAGMSPARRLSDEEAGYLKHTQVRCENCRYGGDRCKLYMALNRSAPNIFHLEEKITPLACCSAWRVKPTK